MKVSLGESRATDDSTGFDLWQNRPVELPGRISSSLEHSLSDSKNVSTTERFCKRLKSPSTAPERCVSHIRTRLSLIRQNVNLAVYGASKKSERVISCVIWLSSARYHAHCDTDIGGSCDRFRDRDRDRTGATLTTRRAVPSFAVGGGFHCRPIARECRMGESPRSERSERVGTQGAERPSSFRRGSGREGVLSRCRV